MYFSLSPPYIYIIPLQPATYTPTAIENILS